MAYTKTNLRISTMVITAHWGTSIQLTKLFDLLRSYIIPVWYPEEGVLKIEHGNNVLGASHKDIFTNRKISDKTFFNQSTIVVRRKIMEEKEDTWKEVNIKLFANGGIQMTGVTSEDFAHNAIYWLHNLIKTMPESPFDQPVNIHRFSVQLINTDYSLNKFINQLSFSIFSKKFYSTNTFYRKRNLFIK